MKNKKQRAAAIGVTSYFNNSPKKPRLNWMKENKIRWHTPKVGWF